MLSNPKISIIVPVYNCAEYLPRCIESLIAQTFKDFEIILIDDGSTDGTYELAASHAAEHANMSVIRQEHQYAGTARNRGMELARGEFLLFLDGDDYFSSNLLADSYERIEQANADICVFKAESLNNLTGEIKDLPHTCRVDLCPSSGIFNRMTNPRYIFCFTTPAPWTKLFRRSFVERQRLKFQNTRSANDFYFVLTALAVADRIAVLDRRLVTYRQKNASSLQATQHKDPLAFYRALEALQAELAARGLTDELRQPFINAALDFCIYNLTTLEHNPEAQKLVYELLKAEGFEKFGIAGKQRDYFYVYPKSRFRTFESMQTRTFEEYRATLHPQKDERPMSSFKKAVRKIIPLRASSFEKSKAELKKDMHAMQEQLDQIQEQNRDLSDKLSVCLAGLNRQNETNNSTE